MLEQEKPLELKDWAYTSIKKAILNSKMPVGKQLHIEKLTEEMKISRTPIREALIMLEHEGLISVSPRVGFFVKGITKQDLNELFELRMLVESYAAEKATSHLADKDLDTLSVLQAEGAEAVARGDYSKFLQTEIRLHSFIMIHAQNKHLLRMVEGLKDLTYRERLLSLESAENVKKSLTEHRKIINAFQKKNGRLAKKMMSEHICNVKKRLLTLLDTLEDTKAD